MQNQLVELKNTRYYQLINLHYNYALYISSGLEQFAKQKAYVVQPNQQSLGQLWQIILITDNLLYRNCYEIVHSRSTLVLTKFDNNQVKLKYGQQKATQLFQIQKIQFGQKGKYAYRFISMQNKDNSLYQDTYLKVGKHIPNDKKFLWFIIPCTDNGIINRSCYFQNSFSNLSIDVPKASLKQDCQIIQYTLNNRFNQRFNIFYENNVYRICNLNSKMYLTAHKKCREGDKVTQNSQIQNSKQQQWIIQYQGTNLYVIRSCMNQKMMLGIRQNSLKSLSPIITTENYQFCLWKIIGYLPNKKNLSKF